MPIGFAPARALGAVERIIGAAAEHVEFDRPS
jgi:hypothetical protein